MKRLIAVFPPDRLERVKKVLYPLDIGGMIITEVRGIGLQRGPEKLKEMRFFEYPKVRLEIIVKDKEVERAIDLLIETIQTGRVGDGKIFISEISDAVRIRTGERGETAI
ncbi:MAG: P-II family nitrogen regulator [Elusimicrobia bacterium]|nr:P-II family nitrogen regulator [Elusimicrobiota bacterium]